jgi:hypothetical protein
MLENSLVLFKNKKYIVLFLGVFWSLLIIAQSSDFPSLKKNLNESGTHYIQSSVLGQFWGRYIDFNPGTQLNGYPNPNPFDIGIRRLRYSASAQLTDKVYFFAQFGQNNFNTTSKLYTGAFLHDAVGEYALKPKVFTLGMGLTGWSGLSRYASPSVGAILGLDAPLYQQVTNGINDQFLRKLSLYAKGQVVKLDYRVALTKPLMTQNSSSIGVLNSSNADFSLLPSRFQYQAYLKYQFFEEESNLNAYQAGSYLGKKKILALGFGMISQKDAMWKQTSFGDTINQNMLLLSGDLFLELPLSERCNAISAYLAFADYQMGTNYIRNIGVMNPTNSIASNGASSGSGNSFPMIGTGQTVYTQLAYKFKDGLIKNTSTLQVYADVQYSDFQALDRAMVMYEAGMNWLISGNHHAKLTLGYQDRPVYKLNNLGEDVLSTRKGMLVLQYQISF